jgi:hypothetical protein
MIKRAASGEESSSGDRKRQATSAPLDEDLLRASSQEHDASTVPSMIPINLIAALCPRPTDLEQCVLHQ